MSILRNEFKKLGVFELSPKLYYHSLPQDEKRGRRVLVPWRVEILEMFSWYINALYVSIFFSNRKLYIVVKCLCFSFLTGIRCQESRLDKFPVLMLRFSASLVADLDWGCALVQGAHFMPKCCVGWMGCKDLWNASVSIAYKLMVFNNHRKLQAKSWLLLLNICLGDSTVMMVAFHEVCINVLLLLLCSRGRETCSFSLGP